MITNPHDGLVKLTFGQIEHARGELRAIVPPALSEALQWSTLAVEPGSFVDAAFTYQHTDLLYSLTWRDGRDALVYLLFEHQSAPPTDALMGERLYRYQARIWERWRADHPRVRKLPLIVPIVMYHGAAALARARRLRGADRCPGRAPAWHRSAPGPVHLRAVRPVARQRRGASRQRGANRPAAS